MQLSRNPDDHQPYVERFGRVNGETVRIHAASDSTSRFWVDRLGNKVNPEWVVGIDEPAIALDYAATLVPSYSPEFLSAWSAGRGDAFPGFAGYMEMRLDARLDD